MASTKGKTFINTFTGGLVTDRHPLNTVENTTSDEDNCDLDRKDFRRRRLGFTYEEGYSFNDSTTDQQTADTLYIKTYKWSAVGNDPSLDFTVVQFGSTLHFYDRAVEPMSDGEKSFTVDLDTFAAPTVLSTSTKGVQVASGKGVLFVVGELIEPFYITYDAGSDTITTTEITIRIRDLALRDRTTDYDERPTSLTDALRYDLYNQGWGYEEVVGNDSIRYGTDVTRGMSAIEYYFFATDHYPPRSKPWWVGKRSPIDPGEAGNEVFDPNGVYDSVFAGSTLAPLGHFILDAFNKDRAGASGISSIETEAIETRPTAVAFTAGRVFYGHENLVYYSQLITDDLTAAGDCFQSADPTAEEISDLIATDGGTILIPTSGRAISFVESGNSILAFYNNGIWSISGSQPGDGFAATSHSVAKISSEGAISSRTIFNVEGSTTYWTDNSINVLTGGDGTTYQVSSLSEGKIQDFYEDIAPLAKEFATGAYDKIRKRIVWLFNSNSDPDSVESRFYYDRVLNYDMKHKAFFPYTVSELAITQPSFICDVFQKSSNVILSATEDVVDSNGDVVTDSDGDDVTVPNRTFSTGSTASGVKYLVTGPTLLTSNFFSTELACPTLAEDNVPATSGIVTNWVTPEAVVCSAPSFARLPNSYSGDGVTPPVEDYYTFPYLRVYNFGFDIPAAATIRGVQVVYQAGFKSGVSTLREAELRLAWGSSASSLSDNLGTNEAYPGGLHFTDYERGGEDELWGATLTPAIVNSSDFGVVLKLGRADPLSIPSASWFVTDLGVDNIKVKIWYSV